MSIFGQLDAKAIPASPYYIAQGEYSAEVTKAEYRIRKETQERQLFLEFTIDDEESLFHNKKAAKFFDLVDPELTNEKLMMLPASEQATTHKNLATLKRALCGFNNVKGLGVDPDDLNDENWSPATLQGLKVIITVTNWGPDNQNVNVKYANLVE